MNSDQQELPDDRDIATFVHLHLRTVSLKAPPKPTESQPQLPEGHALYEVEGKARPMLILKVLSRKRVGRREYLLLPITSKGLDASDQPRKDVVPIGTLINQDRNSFITVEPVKYPESMVSRKPGRSPVIAKLRPDVFKGILDQVRARASNLRLDELG